MTISIGRCDRVWFREVNNLGGIGNTPHNGLWKLRAQGVSIISGVTLRTMRFPGVQDSNVYGLFEVEIDRDWSSIKWSSAGIKEAIMVFDKRTAKGASDDGGIRGVTPRIVVLRDLLDAFCDD